MKVILMHQNISTAVNVACSDSRDTQAELGSVRVQFDRLDSLYLALEVRVSAGRGGRFLCVELVVDLNQ